MLDLLQAGFELIDPSRTALPSATSCCAVCKWSSRKSALEGPLRLFAYFEYKLRIRASTSSNRLLIAPHSSRVQRPVKVDHIPPSRRLTWLVNTRECTLHFVAHAISAWDLVGIALDFLPAACITCSGLFLSFGDFVMVIAWLVRVGLIHNARLRLGKTHA